MPANTDRQALRRRNAIQSAAVSTAMRLLCAGVLLWLRAEAGAFLSRVALLLVLANLLTIPLVWTSLWVRLREIAGGEEEEASQY